MDHKFTEQIRHWLATPEDPPPSHDLALWHFCQTFPDIIRIDRTNIYKSMFAIHCRRSPFENKTSYANVLFASLSFAVALGTPLAPHMLLAVKPGLPAAMPAVPLAFRYERTVDHSM